MTFRTFDIDTVTALTDVNPAERPARRTRLRRHSAVLGHRSTGSRISGLGI